MTQQTRYFALRGGLDLVTPAIETPPGRAIAAANYEPHPRGYQRVDGFERFDGRPKPSEASYWVLNFDAGTAAISEGDTVTGATSSATGVALIDAVVESGSYVGSDAAGYLVLTGVSGTFQDNENLQVSAVTKSVADGTASERGALTDANDTTWYQDAIETARADISAVPGSGAIRGVWAYGGDVYAFRDNAGGTAGVMHKATSSGWSEVSLGREIAFTGGSGEVAVFDTLASVPETVPEIVGAQDAINNGATVSEELNTPGMTFDGASWVDSGTKLSEAGSLFADTAGHAWTVECRFKVDDVTANRGILIRGSGRGVGGNFALWVDTSGNLQCRIRGGTTTQLAAGVNDGSFHEVAVVWDTTNCLGYVDEAPAVSIATDGVAALTSTNHYDNLGIGGRADGGALSNHNGQITEVRVWNVVRTAAQIIEFDTRRLKGSEEGLVAYWPMSIVEGEFEEGQTVTGGTSGATATINRVVVESGAFSTQDAAGRLIIGTVTSGPFQDDEDLTTDTANATADGADAAITLSAGGRYDFRNYNFFGSADLKRMYGCNGKDRGFEFDGTVFVPIATGTTTDTPTRVEAHSNHLFFAFAGGSLQHSSIGNPYQWQVLTGAGELGIGEEITDLQGNVSGAMAVFGRNKVAVLFGTDSANWDFKTLADDAGAVAWTAQNIGSPIYLDNRGLRSLETTEKFGDFQIGTITQLVEPIFRAKKVAGVSPIGSIRVRDKDQYRLFWDDGTGLTVYFGRRTAEGYPEILPFDLGVNLTCMTSGKDDDDGAEILLAGDDEGMVYQLDAGTSFDGEEVEAFLRLPFNHVGSPAQRKRWHKASLEMESGPNTQIGLVAEFSYADPDQPPELEQTFNVKGQGGLWDEFTWDNFYWSSPVEGTAECHLDGLGRNISVAVISDATYEDPHVLHGAILAFSYRGQAR